MLQLMLFPLNWTLPISGAVVGFLTNWIALQLIFKPIEPFHVELGGVSLMTIQGFCLARQKEVSVTFSEFIATNVLTSEVGGHCQVHVMGDLCSCCFGIWVISAACLCLVL